jgi:hypothetical protein
MSVIDLIESLGMPLHTLSFPSMVSLALSSCLEALRQQGTVPDRDGFEYNERTTGIIGTGQTKKKRAATDAILATGSEFKVSAPPKPSAAFVKSLSQNGTKKDDGYVSIRDAVAQMDAGELSEVPQTVPVEEEIVTTEMRLARRRLAELVAKQDLIEAKAPGVTWSSGDQREFDELCKVVYGA